MKTLCYSLLIGALITSCAPDSKITSSWTSARKTKGYHSLVVVALTHDVNAQKLVEGDLANALAKKNVTVYRSLEVFPPNYSKDTPKDEMLVKVRKAGADAIVTVTLLNKQTQTRYIPGYPGYAPGFWGYYSFWYPTVYSPGYYAQDRVYYIETNVYDVSNDELIWSAQSETYNPASLTGFSNQLASILANQLRKDNVIVPLAQLPHAERKVTSGR